MSDQDPPSAPTPPPWGHDPFPKTVAPDSPSPSPSVPERAATPRSQRRVDRTRSSLWIIAGMSGLIGAGLALAGLWATGAFPSSSSTSTTQSVASATSETSNPPEDLPMTGSTFLATAHLANGQSTNGIVISPEYIAIPASAEVEAGTKVEVVQSDGNSCVARFVGTDELTQITVLHCEGATSVGTLTPGSAAHGQQWIASDLLLGRQVDTFPINLDQRFVTGDGIRVYGFLELDQPVSNGTALWSENGDWIGMTVSPLFRDDAVTPGELLIEVRAAVPSQLLLSIAEDLIASGEVRHGAIGVETIDWLESGSISPAGAEVWTVVNPQSELQRGDIILRVDDQTISTADSLVSHLRFYREGDTISLTILRRGEESTIQLKLAGISEQS